jgi:antitoxin component of RelBE/YafQ-DinJ toxin-antitoxin module
LPAEALITHIDETTRRNAEAAFATAGLTLNQAIQRLLLQAANHQIVPFVPYDPYATALQAAQ